MAAISCEHVDVRRVNTPPSRLCPADFGRQTSEQNGACLPEKEGNLSRCGRSSPAGRNDKIFGGDIDAADLAQQRGAADIGAGRPDNMDG